MLFNSLQFLFFFPIVTIIYFLLPHRFRWFHLLLASCFFYASFIPAYILILFFTIAIDYVAGILIENTDGRRKKWYLVMSIVTNVGILAYFKYYNFFIDNINGLLHGIGITTHSLPFYSIILPIGLSFHTFQAMSYTIEVYRGNQKAEKHFGIYALYVMFYPQLVAGPIERPQNVLHQFYEKKQFNYDDAVSGLKLMLWGMFKKVVIADRLAVLTDPVFNHPHDYPAISLAIAALFFTFQIYTDFSGYSDIALGSARFMGFKLMKNFDRPYASKSIAEFWSRWHISLSTWFRDYLYIPLGGNRVGIPRWYFNLFFVFLVSGFWHGANWTFIVWGALHGFYLIAAIVIGKIKEKYFQKAVLKKASSFRIILNTLITFVLVSVAWVFFRANSVSDGFYIVGKLPNVFGDILNIVETRNLSSMKIWSIEGLDSLSMLIYMFAIIVVLEGVQYIHFKYNIVSLLRTKPIVFRWALYYVVILIILFFGVFQNKQFIYFQF